MEEPEVRGCLKYEDGTSRSCVSRNLKYESVHWLRGQEVEYERALG